MFTIVGYSDTSFLATFDTSSLTPTDPIVFNNPVLNTGGHYDPATGIYTVPVDGTYEFIFHMQTLNDNTAAGVLEVDNVQVVTFICN